MIHTTLMGFVGRAVEDRVMPNSTKVRSFSLCVEKDFWVNCSVFGDKLDKVLSYVKKGSAICVHGSIRKPEIYTNKSGAQTVTLNVVVDSICFLPKPKDKDEEPKVYGEKPKPTEPSPFDTMELPF